MKRLLLCRRIIVLTVLLSMLFSITSIAYADDISADPDSGGGQSEAEGEAGEENSNASSDTDQGEVSSPADEEETGEEAAEEPEGEEAEEETAEETEGEETEEEVAEEPESEEAEEEVAEEPESEEAEEEVAEEPEGEETGEETAGEETEEECLDNSEGEEEGETVAEILDAMEEKGTVLVDEEGNPLSMAAAETAELLEDPDPYIIRGGVTYNFTASDCDPVTAGPQACSDPVQQAINFANPGETVYLEGYTFTEQLEITKNLTLQGTTGTVIKSPTTLVDYFQTSQKNYPVIYVHDAENVTISGLTVDGDNQGDGNYRFIGIGYHNAGGTISDVTVTNIMNSTFSGAQHGLAIYAYNEDGKDRTLKVKDNKLTNYQKNGMALIGSGLTVEVTGNTVTGQGPTSVTAQNGIQVSHGVTGTIGGNTVTGNWYTGGYWVASGILINNTSGTMDVNYNTVTDNQVNLYNYLGGVDFSNNTVANGEINVLYYGSPGGTITNNTVTGGDVGVWVYYSDPSIVANYNTISGNVDGLIFDDGTSTLMDATYNYWGCKKGPGTLGCDTVYGAYYKPYLPLYSEPTGGFPPGQQTPEIPLGIPFSLPVTGDILLNTEFVGVDEIPPVVDLYTQVGSAIHVSLTDPNGNVLPEIFDPLLLAFDIPGDLEITDGSELILLYYDADLGWTEITFEVIDGIAYGEVMATGYYTLAIKTGG